MIVKKRGECRSEDERQKKDGWGTVFNGTKIHQDMKKERNKEGSPSNGDEERGNTKAGEKDEE